METLLTWLQSDAIIAILAIIGYLLTVCLIAMVAFFCVAALECPFRLIFGRR